jgi:hypothetical protein
VTRHVVDTDDLPPTQYLICEVLAARWRTGEATWTFPSRLRWALLALAEAGLIGVKSGVGPRTFIAWFTEAGRKVAMSETYEPPTNRPPTPEEGIMTDTEREVREPAHGWPLSLGNEFRRATAVSNGRMTPEERDADRVADGKRMIRNNITKAMRILAYHGVTTAEYADYLAANAASPKEPS